MKRVEKIEHKNIILNFPELERCCEELLNDDEKAYLFPILVYWTGSEVNAVLWLKSETISAFGGQTGLEVCRSHNSEGFVHYIQHIEIGGFA